MIQSLQTAGKYKNKWTTELLLNTVTNNDNYGSDIWWKKVNKLFFNCTEDTNLRWFQYRLVHRILPTNKFLHKINIKTNDLCSFCGEQSETFGHLFWDCDLVASFWLLFADLIKQTYNIDIHLDKTTVIFGVLRHSLFQNCNINLLILLAKKFLYLQKMTHRNLNIHTFVNFIRSYSNEIVINL